MKTRKNSYGYYTIVLSALLGRRLLYSNTERAFIVAQLQDLLSPRLLINTVPAHTQLASCVDLLAFSIRADSVQLIVFAIDRMACQYLAAELASRLTNFRDEQHTLINTAQEAPQITPYISLQKLKGPHHALQHSVTIHLQHEDWEYDRYSSIGFYLHDRRGDWVRLWRLVKLYDNNSAYYRSLVYYRLEIPPTPMQPNQPSFAPLPRV